MEKGMLEAAKRISWSLLRGLSLGWLVSWLHPRSALRVSGWFRSFRTGKSVDRNGQPIPWFSYPAVDFLSRIDLSDLRVFEYGSGGSTVWFSKRTKEVVSVEHDERWSGFVSRLVSPPHKVILRPAGPRYIEEIGEHGRFDVVVVDGLDRGRCALAAVESLTAEGVIIWDDASRADFSQALPEITDRGFRRLVFAGMAPVSFLGSETAVFYRRGRNCLGL